MPYRALLVDDEPHARALMREYLGAVEEVDVVGEAGSGREALAAIRTLRPDLVFLDVQMPGLTGFDMLDRLDALPVVVFTTAYDAFAVRAFEAGAVDYLLKPYDRVRFDKALGRALAQLEARTAEPALDATPSSEADAVNALLAQTSGGLLKRVFVREGKRIVPVVLDAVEWIEAAGDYARLHVAGADDVSTQHLCSLTLTDLEERLDPERFARVHRSAIVALPALRHLVSDGSGGYLATMHSGARVRVSRTYASAIRERIV